MHVTSWLMPCFPGLSLWRLSFNTRDVYVGFGEGRVASGQVFVPVLHYLLDSIILPVVHAHAKWPQRLMVLLNNAHNEGVRLDTECTYV